MEPILLKEIYGDFVNSLIAIFVVGLTYILVDLLVIRKIESGRQKRKVRIRSSYVASFILIFLMARIWVEGFTHLLAVLGLVSAALVVTNKETIMNFVGWLIINWRDLFAEDDLIQIQQYKGYVKSFGVLYFTLSEVSECANGNITGRVIRIPNGLVASNVLVNYSQTSHLLERKFSIIIIPDSDIQHAISFLKKHVDAIISKYYEGKKEYSLEYLYKHHKYLMSRIDLGVSVSVHLKLEKPTGIELVTRYYCFSQDIEKIQQKIWLTILEAIKQDKKITLAYCA